MSPLLLILDLAYEHFDVFDLFRLDALRQDRCLIIFLTGPIRYHHSERVLWVKASVLLLLRDSAIQVLNHVVLWRDPGIFQDKLRHALGGRGLG